MKLTTQAQRRAEEEVNFPRLHEVSRHCMHSTETLEVAYSTLKRMREQYERSACEAGHKTVMSDYFHFQEGSIESLGARSRSNEKRLANEINLVSCEDYAQSDDN